jgi:hypothetical protein
MKDNNDDYSYKIKDHPLREIGCYLISPLGWLVFVFLLLLI